MASKVNVKFVSLLAAGLIGAFALVAGATYYLVTNSATDLARMGDRAVGEGKYDDAVIYYGKAVFKEKTNTEYLGKWRDALRKLAPAEQVRYADNIRSLQSAIRQIAVVQRDNVDAQREYLEMIKRQVLDGPFQREATEFMVNETNTFLAYHAGKPAGPWEVLRRYRGLAEARIVGSAPDAAGEMGKRAEEDLRAALRADPTDIESSLMLQSMLNLLAIHAGDTGQSEEKARLDAAALEISAAFSAANPGNPGAMLQKLRRDFETAIRDARTSGADAKAAGIAFQAAAKPRLVEAMAMIKADPSTATLRVLDMLRSMEQTVDPAARLARSEEATRLAAEKRPGDVDLAIARADILAAREDIKGATAELDRIVGMAMPTISIEGSRLFGQRIQARFLKALFTVRAWQRATAEARPELAKAALEHRGEMAKVEGPDSPRLVLIDGWLAYIDGKLPQANELIARFNKMTQGTDPDALLLSAQIALQLQQPGLARDRLNELLQLPGQAGNILAILTLGDVELMMQNLERAEQLYASLAEFLPDNAEIQKRLTTVRALRGRGTVADTIQQAIIEAQGLQERLGDKPGAAEEVVKFLEGQFKTLGPDPRLARALVTARLKLDQREQALADVRTAIAAHSDDAGLKQMEILLTISDELEQKLAMLEFQRGTVSDGEIELARYLAYRTHGKTAEADAALAKAQTLLGNDGRIIEIRFVDAINANDMAGASKLVDQAKDANADNVDGVTFRARLLAAENRLPEALVVMKDVVDRAAVQPEHWRLYGRLLNGAGRSGDAEKAFREALKLRPNDVGAINELVGTLGTTGRREEALAAARQYVKYAEGDAQFLNMWLELEGELGDRKMVAERRSRARAANPRDRANLMALAQAHMDLGEMDKAREVIDAAGELGKGLDWVALDAGYRWTTNDQIGAIKGFEEFIASLPKQEVGPYLTFAQFLLDRADQEGAIQQLQKARAYQDPKTLEVDRLLSDNLFRMGESRYAETAAILEGMLAANADDEAQSFRKRLAEVQVMMKEFEKADATLAGVKGRETDVSAMLLTADVLGGRGDSAKQRAALDQAVVRFPNDARVFFKRGQLLMSQDRKSRDALADFSRAIQLQPNLWPAYRLRAAIHSGLDDKDSAIADLRTVIRLNPSDTMLAVGLISDLLQLESAGSRPRDQDAEIIADEAIRARPRDVQLAFRIGETFFRNNRLAPARRFLKNAFDIDQQDGVAFLYLDSLLVRENPALAEAERVLTGLTRPKDRVSTTPGLMMAVARLRMLQDRRGEGASAAVAALRLLDWKDPQAMMGWNASMRDALDKPEQRRAFYENAISQGVASPETTEWLAYFRARIDVDAESTLETGLRTLREIVRSSKNPALRQVTLRTLGSTLYTFARFQEAVDAMKPGLEEFPEDMELLNNTAFMLSKKLNNPELALPLAERAAKLAPRSSDVLDTLGVTLMAIGKLPEAEVQLRDALKFSPTPSGQLVIAVHLIDALARQKTPEKTTEAKELAGKAQQVAEQIGAQADAAVVAELQQLRTTLGL